MRMLIDSAIYWLCVACVLGALSVSVLVLFGDDFMLLAWLVIVSALVLMDA